MAVPDPRWHVGVIDSGISPGCPVQVDAVRRFIDDGSRVVDVDAIDDTNGHGSAVAVIVTSAAQPCRLSVAQALDSRGRSTPAIVAAAIHWGIARGVQLLHLSLGLAEDRRALADAVQAAAAAGVLVVASAPARGRKLYPASYNDVLAVTGDARCAPDEVSDLDDHDAEFGGCVGYCSELNGQRLGGASIGAAYVSRFLLSHAPPGTPLPQARALLRRMAVYRGRERRRF